MVDQITCEVCEKELTEDEACYRYLGDDGDYWACEEEANAMELHTFCEVHAPDCGYTE